MYVCRQSADVMVVAGLIEQGWLSEAEFARILGRVEQAGCDDRVSQFNPNRVSLKHLCSCMVSAWGDTRRTSTLMNRFEAAVRTNTINTYTCKWFAHNAHEPAQATADTEVA